MNIETSTQAATAKLLLLMEALDNDAIELQIGVKMLLAVGTPRADVQACLLKDGYGALNLDQLLNADTPKKRIEAIIDARATNTN